LKERPLPTVTDLGPGLRAIDLEFQGRPGVIAAYLLEDSGERALIETGPSSTLGTLLVGLESIGVSPDSLSKLIVTHIHLDHAGAVGTLVQRYPQLELHVHEIGAGHMANPTALLKSATRIYGDQMERLWGEVAPVPPDRIRTLEEGDHIMIGNRRLDVLYTPGHASHHVIFHDATREGVFAGDVAAIRMQGFDYVLPPTPPPDIDLEQWDRSLERIRELHAKTLYIAHFGAFADVESHLSQTHERLHGWSEVVQAAMKRGLERGDIRQVLQAHAVREITEMTGDEGAVEEYAMAGPFGMSADGYLRYFRNKSQVA
jgi:glyoxylase-like metal-dependent hydrolase (beta-lactamase superfamily II)